MTSTSAIAKFPDAARVGDRGIYYGGAWHTPVQGRYALTLNPGTGDCLGRAAEACASDVEAAVVAAKHGFAEWQSVLPSERARILRAVAVTVREHAEELAMLDAANCGNPVSELMGDASTAAAQLDFFAGLVTEMKGASFPVGPDRVNFSIRQPMGVVARILAFNHPSMFCAGKIAAPLAAGNAVIVKPPEQAPLSSLRLAELLDGLLPPGVFNVVPGGREAGAALASHKDVAKVALIGSVAAGRAVLRSASDTIKPALLELGGKNALVAFPDADPSEVADALIGGMNFGWCGQSCGSTSRAFLHADLHDAVLELVAARIGRYRPGLPTDPATTMGSLVSRAQYERVLAYIESGKAEGARILCGGKPPEDAGLAGGFYIEPTVFHEVTPTMRIAAEEIFGPVLSVLRWTDRRAMMEAVNGLEYGLTCSIWTNNLAEAHRTAHEVQAGYVWVNEVSRHFLGAPFGGVKHSGIGREECLAELLDFTDEKNIHINLRRPTM